MARAIASDISLYNEAKVKQGIENDSFFDVLAKEIQEGREHYNTKVDPGLRQSTNFFERALVDVIVRLSWLLADFPEIVEIDLNPVRVFEKGCQALDWRILKGPS